MKKHLYSIVLLFGLLGFAFSASAQDNMSNLLAEGYTLQEMETLFKNITYKNYDSYLKDKGFTFKEEFKAEELVAYKKNNVVTLYIKFKNSQLFFVGFSSSPQKWYQAKAQFTSDYTKLPDATADGNTFMQWEKNGYLYRAIEKESFMVIMKKP